MAEYFEFDSIFNGYSLPEEMGYSIVSLFGKDKTEYDHRNIINEWIEENISGPWSTFMFGIPRDGQSYCFLDEEDAMAFRLRWS